MQSFKNKFHSFFSKYASNVLQYPLSKKGGMEIHKNRTDASRRLLLYASQTQQGGDTEIFCRNPRVGKCYKFEEHTRIFFVEVYTTDNELERFGMKI